MKWHKSTLEKLIELENGYAFKSNEYAEYGHFLMRITNVQQGYISSQSPKYVSIPANTNLKQYELHEGDLLMSLTGNVGRVGFIEDHHLPAALNQRVARIKIKDTKNIDKRYLFNFFNSVDIRAKIEKLANGAAQLNLSTKDIKSLSIPLPPLAEQQRIAALLDTADRILKLRELAIAKLDELAQSVFVDMFGDPFKPKFKFKVVELGQLILEMRGGASLKPEDFVESGFPILHKGAIKKHGLIEIDLKKKTFASLQYAKQKKSSIVSKEFMAVTLRDLVPTGPSIGLIVNLNDGDYDEYLLAQGAYGFKIDLKKITPEYLIALSNMPSFREVLKKYSVGSTQIHMRGPVFTSLKINLPEISMQQKFSQVIKNIWKLRSIENSFLEKEKVLMNSLQHQSFAVN